MSTQQRIRNQVRQSVARWMIRKIASIQNGGS